MMIQRPVSDERHNKSKGYSESQLQRQLHRSRLNLSIKILAEARRFHNPHRWAKNRLIEQVENLQPEMDRLVFGNSEGPRQRGVHSRNSAGSGCVSSNSARTVRKVAIAI